MKKTYSTDELIKARIAVNDTIQIAQDDLTANLKPSRRKLEVLDGVLLNMIQATSLQKNIKSESGTAYKEKKESYTVKDRKLFLQWIMTNNRFDLLDVRVDASAAKKYLKDTDGLLPDGIGYSAFILLRTRRSNPVITHGE